MVYCGKPSKGCLVCRQRKIRVSENPSSYVLRASHRPKERVLLELGTFHSTRLNKVGEATDEHQCDEGMPSCGQCIKIEKDCPGYRDMLSLSFRNESDAVIEKAKAKASKSRNSLDQRQKRKPAAKRGRKQAISESGLAITFLPNRSTQDLPETFFSGYNAEILSRRANATNSPAPTIHPDPDERGTNYFFVHFVADENSHGLFKYLNVIVKDGVDGLLQSCIIAAGLAGLSNVSRSTTLMSHARFAYAKALRYINAAVASPIDAVQDATLAGILILAVYEPTAGAWMMSMISQAASYEEFARGWETSMKAWEQHINGAAALLLLRGPAQFATKIGTALFAQAASHLLISCLQKDVCISPQIVELSDKAFKIFHPNGAVVQASPIYKFYMTLYEFANLRGAINNGSISSNYDIIDACLSIDRRLAEITVNCPPDWEHEAAFATTHTDLLFDGYYDIYHSSFVARRWNGLRVVRIMCNQTIRWCLINSLNEHLFSREEYETLLQVCTDNIESSQYDILHSVPQFLGFVKRKPFENPTPPEDDVYLTDLLSDPDLQFIDPAFRETTPPLRQTLDFPTICGYFLLWPLRRLPPPAKLKLLKRNADTNIVIAGSVHSTPPAVKSYIIKTLRYVGNELGIAEGLNIAAILEMPNGEMQERAGVATLGKFQNEVWGR